MTIPFFTVADVRLIEKQVNKILSAYMTSKDPHIINTVRGLATAELRENLTVVDETILSEVETISETIGAELFINSLKAYTVPFKAISEKELQKLFRKEKKLRLPNLERVNWYGISYLSWLDVSTHRQYIVIEKEDEYIGLRGVVKLQKPIKGVCAICNQHSDVHLFTATVKGQADAYTSYSNYICDNVESCNSNVSNYTKLEAFVARNII